MKKKVLIRYSHTLIILLLLALVMPIFLHWKIFESDAWPKQLLITKNLYVFYKLSLYLNINIIRFNEILYYIIEIISLFIIIYSFKRIIYNKKSNILGTLLCLLAIIYFEFYPYNKLSDAIFRGIYVLMTIAASLSVYMLTSVVTSNNLKDILKTSFLYSIFLFLTSIIIGQRDPRILVYPLTLTFLILIISFILVIFTRKFLFTFIKVLLFFVPPLVLLYLMGSIRVKISESLAPIVPLDLDAFRGRYDAFHLISGTSWVLAHVPSKLLIAVTFFVFSMLILFSILFFKEIENKKVLNRSLGYDKEIVINGYVIILTYIIILLFELNIKSIIRFLLNFDYTMLLLNKVPFIRDFLIMLRIPRFMDFSNKVIVTFLMIQLGEILGRSRLKNIKKYLKIMIVLIIIFSFILAICNILMLKPLMKEGAVLNYNPKSIVLLGAPSKPLARDFPIAGWDKEKLLLEAFLLGRIKVGSLILYDDGIIPIKFRPYANIFKNAGFSVSELNLTRYFAIVKLNKTMIVGRPVLIPQGLYLGSEAWKKGYIPVYLDQIVPLNIVKKILNLKIPIMIYKNKEETAKILAMWLILNNRTLDANSAIKIIVPSFYAKTFTPSLTQWSPGFIGDPHHGIFYEPAKIYEYDYTYKLNWGVIQGRAVKEPLRIPFKLGTSGKYVIMVRLMSTGNGSLRLYLDGRNCAYLKINKTENINSRIGFIWVDVCNINIKKGIHLLKIYWLPAKEESAASTIYLNLILLVREKLWRDVLNYSLNYINNNNINLSSLSNITKRPLINVRESKTLYPFLGREFNINISISNIREGVPWIIVTRLPWGYPLKINNNKNILEAFSTPVDYVKTGIIIISKNNRLTFQIKEYQEYTTPMGFIKIITIYLATIILLYGLICFAKKNLKK